MPISTQNLQFLPPVADLHRVLQALAMLDAILSPTWDYRYYSFNARWSAGEQLGSMRNGSGDDVFVWFNEAGACFIKGFAHESAMSPYAQFGASQIWPGVLDEVPAEFSACLQEPAFSMEDTTFCIWRRPADLSWQHGTIDFPPGTDPDGSNALLSILDGKPESYQAWAEVYYERAVSLAVVSEIYTHTPLNRELVKELNPEVEPEDLAADIEEIGYSNPTGRQPECRT